MANASGGDGRSLIVAFAAVAGAAQWNDRITLKFAGDAAIPGATLAPETTRSSCATQTGEWSPRAMCRCIS
jgi:hypothetical protein